MSFTGSGYGSTDSVDSIQNRDNREDIKISSRWLAGSVLFVMAMALGSSHVFGGTLR